jgi:hypothetical protein
VRKFKDSAGREWNIPLTGSTMKRLKDQLREKNVDLWEPMLPRGVDPKSPQNGIDPRASLLVELQTDIPLFYDVLEAIVAPQLQAKGISSDGEGGFGDSMAGDQIFTALSAFMDEWRDFFQKLRPEVTTAMTKTQAWWEKAVKAAEMRLSDPRIDEAMARKLEEATNNASTKMLELLDSIPTDAPSVN